MASIPLPSHSIASPILTQVNLNNMNPSTSQTTQPSSSTKRESRKSAERIPRPRNAWILYRSAMIKTLTPPPPGARRRTQGEISRILAPMWASATPEVRAFYQDEAAREKAEHAARYPDYKFAPVKKEVREQQRKEKKRQERSVRGTRRRETRSSPEPSLRPGRAAPSRQKTDMPLGLMEEEPRGLGIEAGPTQLQMPQPSRAYIPSQRYLSLPSPASSSQPHNIPARQCPPPLSPQGWQPTVLTAAPRRAVRQVRNS
ncbi:hypothetical protein DENSPDRAFT_551397 [Dentipellis sp. KUC8613]|nr:hypothetical protein DENSPDRAFT_551397 [Dentipellis sp. KUC8613]